MDIYKKNKASQNDDDHLRMSWVANELVCDGERFYMECVREPPEWFLWWEKYIWSIFVWYIAGCGAVKRRSTSIKLGSEYSVFATKILSESKKGSNDRKAKFQKSFILLVQVLERGGYSTQCEQVQLYLTVGTLDFFAWVTCIVMHFRLLTSLESFHLRPGHCWLYIHGCF